jgi:predicted metal-dependent hydrolase
MPLTARVACSIPIPDAAAVSDDIPERAEVLAFKREVRRWARKMEVVPKSITVRSMEKKWGSCSIDGRLTFDLSLVGRPRSSRSEVIIHELLHLRIPNHGPLFRSLLRAYLRERPKRHIA